MKAAPLELLLVEDEDEHAELIEYFLSKQQRFRYRLTRAVTSQVMEDALNQQAFDVILLDLGVKDCTIQESLAKLPRLSAERPVLVLTSLDDPETGDQAVQNGAEDFLPKSDLSERRLADAMRYAIERHELKRKLREAQQKAEQSAAMKADFLATMSHEIRTPMNAVIGFTNLLLDTKLTEDQERYVRTIANSGEALLVVINDILDFSKIESGKLLIENIAYDLNEAISDVMSLFRPRALAKGITLEAIVNGNLSSHVMGDPSRVRQVLINLIGNAIKFTQVGSVRLLVRGPAGGAGELEFSVEDTGAGIPESYLATMFEKFTQADTSTSRRHGGTGLGLAITKQLTELMGGQIIVESKLLKGSTFTVRLPYRPTDAPEGSQRTPSEDFNPEGTAGLRILLADDSATNQLLARRILEKMGCIVDVVGNGLEAVEIVQQLEYDVILMDCHMPEMDGYEAARAIRNCEQKGSWRRIPILALTAGAMAEDRTASIEAGMDDHLTKPIRQDRLRAALVKWATATKVSGSRNSRDPSAS